MGRNSSRLLLPLLEQRLGLGVERLPCAVLPPMATKPLRFRALRADLTASHQALRALLPQFFLARAEAFFDTILPFLFLVRLSLVMPLWVFTLEPRKTTALAILPLAMMLTLFAFIAFMAFIVVFFAFIAFIAFMAATFFMGSAIAVR